MARVRHRQAGCPAGVNSISPPFGIVLGKNAFLAGCTILKQKSTHSPGSDGIDLNLPARSTVRRESLKGFSWSAVFLDGGRA